MSIVSDGGAFHRPSALHVTPWTFNPYALPLLVAGVVGIAILMQGIQSVSLPMVQEFGYTREIEDRVLAPMPVWLVAIQKAIWGALSGLFSALLVFPIAAVVPATPSRWDDAVDRAVGILAVEAMVVLYALVIVGPLALLALVAWLARRGLRRRQEEQLLSAS